MALLAAPGVPYVLVENVGFSLNEIEADLVKVTEAVNESVDADFDVAAQPASGTFDVTLRGSDAMMSRSFSPSGIEELQTETGLRVEVSKAPDTTIEATSYGRHAGTWLVDDNFDGYCTSGFVAKSTSSSALGVLTAGHCTANMRYYNHQSGDVFPVTNVTGGIGSLGDARFLRSPYMLDAWFMADTNAGRPVQEVRNPNAGEFICRYGARTADDMCANVLALSTSYVTDGLVVGQQSSVRTWVQHGDSGGPVYGGAGYTALGLISAGAFVNGAPVTGDGRLTYFTKIKSAEGQTGTQVCRDPVCG